MVLLVIEKYPVYILEVCLVVYFLYLWWNHSGPGQDAVNGVTDTMTDDKPDWKSFDWSSMVPRYDFDLENTPEKPWRPWSNGPYFVTMGLRKTQLNDWLEIDKNYMSRYHYKRHLMAHFPDVTLQTCPGSLEASMEALDTLVELLPKRYPTMFKRIDHGIINLITNDEWDLRPKSKVWEKWHPLQIMGLLATEDFLIMQTEDDGLITRLTAGCVCFPAGWKISERIGLSIRELHGGKVPHYEERLSKSMDRFFSRVRVDSPQSRFNYAIDNSSELHHINPHHSLTQEDLKEPLTLDQLHLRVERQVLQRLPKSRAIIFSIRTYITPVSEVIKDREVALALRTSVNSYSPEVAKYKNKPLWTDIVGEHLDKIYMEETKE